MSKLNRSPRRFNIRNRMVTVFHPRVKTANDRSWTKQDYVTVPAIEVNGSWPVVHMVDEDTFVQMAILAKHVTPDARKRYQHSRAQVKVSKP